MNKFYRNFWSTGLTMKKIIIGTALVAVLALTFLAGYWYSNGPSPGSGAGGGNKILYYVDPMNPGHRYDKPGIAPCGMALEPVYAEGGGVAKAPATIPGTVMITPEKQQLIGVKIEQVEQGSALHTIRLLGKVAADDTRIYQINSSVAGWIRQVYPYSTGSLVKKGAPLATFYAPEFLAAEQSYVYALNSLSLRSNVKAATGVQPNLFGQSVRQYEDNLRNIGMGENQIKELGRTREFADSIQIESPVTGFVLTRNISPGLRFDKGAEFYRIADLRKVWIVLDTYGNEAKYFRPGEKVPVRYQGETFYATVSNVLPQFDPATRTLKVRLIADNPRYLLRPEMFVDVEFPVTMPPALTVPVDAVLDSGLKKTVYVARGNGFFEPRKVETGRYFGDRVEIMKGLMAGERIVVSGNFLIDSESRFKSSSAEATGPMSVDPSCGMLTSEEKARESGLTTVYQGKSYFFCSRECKERFDKSPQGRKGGAGAGMPAAGGKPAEKTHDHTKMPGHNHTDRQMQMPGHKHDDMQMKMPGGMPSDNKHDQMRTPGNRPAVKQMTMPGEMPVDSMKEEMKMPEAGHGENGNVPMKMDNENEGARMEDSPPMAGEKPND
jgi:membrane fusion protein, copper/silver efflux system